MSKWDEPKAKQVCSKCVGKGTADTINVFGELCDNCKAEARYKKSGKCICKDAKDLFRLILHRPNIVHRPEFKEKMKGLIK